MYALIISLVFSLISAVSEKFTHKIGAFILVVLKLPRNTDSEELKNYLKESLKNNYGWEKNPNEIKIPTITKDNFTYYLNPGISSEWTEVFLAPQKSFAIDPADKNIIVSLKYFGEDKYLYIYVKHESTQYTGRKSQKEISDKVLGIIQGYYTSKNIDISSEFKIASTVTDDLEKYDKLTFWKVLFVVFVSIPLIIIILFILAHIIR